MAVVTFEDGPAQRGTPADKHNQLSGFEDESPLVLHLRRLPVFLRLVHDPEEDTWDALDQEDDEPEPCERVWVYVRSTYGHSRGQGRFATYCHVFISPYILASSKVRSKAGWQTFVDELARHQRRHLDRIYMPDHALIG